MSTRRCWSRSWERTPRGSSAIGGAARRRFSELRQRCPDAARDADQRRSLLGLRPERDLAITLHDLHIADRPACGRTKKIFAGPDGNAAEPHHDHLGVVAVGLAVADPEPVTV